MTNGNNNNGGARSQIDSLIQMNDLKQLYKDFQHPSSAVEGLESLGTGSIGKILAEKLFTILEGDLESPRYQYQVDEHDARLSKVRHWIREGGWGIGDIVSGIQSGVEFKDEFEPGWKNPEMQLWKILSGMNFDTPEKTKGIIGWLQRFLPGGKSGFQEKEPHPYQKEIKRLSS